MELHDSAKIASSREMVVEPSTPKKKPRSTSSRSETFRSTTPTTPKKWTLTASLTTAAISCCHHCNNFMADKEPFADFTSAAASVGISTVESWTQTVIHSVDHMIELASSIETSNSKLSTRYFICLRPENEYHEVDRDFFDYFQENQQATSVERTWFTCMEHQHGYQLLRFECMELVKEGVGLKDAELSPQQFSREKRKIMAKKISYGRNDVIEELARRLGDAKKEDIDALSTRLGFGRKEAVAEVARRLSCSKKSRGEEVDLHLARVSMYYSESGLC